MSKPSLQDTIILTGAAGSHSYGTATAESDYDFMSVVVGSPDVYYGLSQWGSSGTMDDVQEDPVVEHRYYEIRKFVSMCSGMNPNAIPLLWLSNYEAMTTGGQKLVANRHLFNSKKAYQTFSGYAHGQLHKMGGVFNDREEEEQQLRAGHIRFQEWADTEIQAQRGYRDEIAADKLPPDSLRRAILEQAYDSGYLNAVLALNAHSKEEVKRIKVGPVTGRMGAKRKAIRDRFGYDTKFAFHTIRLMRMCVEFLRRPEEGLKVDRRGIDAEFLYSIREGALTQEEVKAMADELFAEAKEAVVTTSLPEKPDNAAIHNLTMDIIKSELSH